MGDQENVRSSCLADFKQISQLGEGAYSSVYKVCRLADKEVYALKKVKLPGLSDKEKQNALNEVRLLASVRHPNVIAYKEAFWDERTKSLCIVTECADGGDLLQQISRHTRKKTHFKEKDIWHYIIGCCQGLKALHDMRVLHRDLKCANVFLSSKEEGNHAKLGDFNVSKVAKHGLCMTQTGTPYYASPEVWRDMPYDTKSDIWSLGCVLYEVASLHPPFRADDMEGLYRTVLKGKYARIPKIYSDDLADVLDCMLQVNPRHRPSVDDLLKMPKIQTHMSSDVLAKFKEPEATPTSDLLRTIKLPKDVGVLAKCLPEPRYTNDRKAIEKQPGKPRKLPRPDLDGNDAVGLQRQPAASRNSPSDDVAGNPAPSSGRGQSLPPLIPGAQANRREDEQAPADVEIESVQGRESNDPRGGANQKPQNPSPYGHGNERAPREGRRQQSREGRRQQSEPRQRHPNPPRMGIAGSDVSSVQGSEARVPPPGRYQRRSPSPAILQQPSQASKATKLPSVPGADAGAQPLQLPPLLHPGQRQQRRAPPSSVAPTSAVPPRRLSKGPTRLPKISRARPADDVQAQQA